MIRVILDKCKGCLICEKNCPVQGISVQQKKAIVNENCVTCGICTRVCPFGALEKNLDLSEAEERCTHCPVGCAIAKNKTGACGRYSNDQGKIVRNRELVIENQKVDYGKANIEKPLITAVGSGTNYPCCRPAPYIIEENQGDVDVVTVVSEAPLSYSGVKVKIDSNAHIGEEGAKVRRDGKIVGMLTTEEYGSKMLTLGGANLLSNGNDGFIVAKTIVDLANGRRVKLKIDQGSILEIQEGHPPLINDKEEKLMRVGCGSATIGMFARQFAQAVDEAVVLDYHVIGLLSEHFAGEEVGLKYTGVVPNGTKSTRGRYFGTHGNGWGGTNIECAKEAISLIDMDKAKPGMRILVTETTGQKAALFQLQTDGTLLEIAMDQKTQEVVNLIRETCEESRVSIIYTGGTGGSARAGVTVAPKKLTEAVHEKDVSLTIAGAPAYILPGGGINFMVNVCDMVDNATTWVPTPATVAPVEYTMTKETYLKLGGHGNAIQTKEELLKSLRESI